MKSLNKSYFDKYVDPIVREIDRVNVYEFENGMDYELLQLGGNIDPENIKKAQTKVLKNLKKDPAFYTNQLAADSVKLVGEFGSGKKAGKYSTPKDAEAVKAEVKTSKDDTVKIDKENEMKIAKKDATSNVSKDKKTKLAPKTKEMTQTPKKAKGIKSVIDSFKFKIAVTLFLTILITSNYFFITNDGDIISKVFHLICVEKGTTSSEVCISANTFFY
jgi:hypothetical protein